MELRSRCSLKTVELTDGSEGALIEGTLGKLVSVGFNEGVVLEIVGCDGILRVDLSREDLEKEE